MGNTTSVNDVRSQMETYIDKSILDETTQNCQSIADMGNKISISNSSGLKVSGINQTGILKDQCLIDAGLKLAESNNMSTDIKDTLKKMQESNGILAFNSDTSNLYTQAVASYSSDVVNKKISSCKSDFKAPNLLELTNITDSEITDVLQSNNIFNECIQGVLSEFNISNESAQVSTQSTDTESKTTTESLSSILGSLTSGPMLILIGAVVLVLVFVLLLKK